jgi:anti-sigma factor RsiW
MSGHVPDDLLASFVDGDVDDQVATHIAEHLDECPACATRAATMEPLASAFAAIDDPEPPTGLIEAVLAEVEHPARGPSTEFVIGAILLTAAGVLAILGSDPVATLVQAGVLADALLTAEVAVTGAPTPSLIAISLSTLTAIGGLFLLTRFAVPDRRLP